MNRDFKQVPLYEKNIKIKSIDKSWEEILNDQMDDFFQKIAYHLLSKDNLYYYTSNRVEVKPFIDSMLEEEKEDAMVFLMSLLKDPELIAQQNEKYRQCLTEINNLERKEKERQSLADERKKAEGERKKAEGESKKEERERKKAERERKKAENEARIEKLNSLCIKYDLPVTKHKSFIKKKESMLLNLVKSSRVGIFGEILFYITVDQFIKDNKLLFGKLSCISAPGTYAHGADGIFIDTRSKNLQIGFGEAKFCKTINDAIRQVKNSIESIERIEKDFLWMSKTINDMKYYSDIQRDFIINTDLKSKINKVAREFSKIDYLEAKEREEEMKSIISRNNLQVKIIVFMMYGGEDGLIKEELKSKLQKENIKLNETPIEIICFPIVDKVKLVDFIDKEIDKEMRKK